LKTPLEFDAVVAAETRLDWRLRDVCHSNIGWYTDKAFCDQHLLDDWTTKQASGVYVLRHKADYYEIHNVFHMRAIYLGKGQIRKRLLAHWKEKRFSGEMLAYRTFLEIRNRQVKYCEQLLLDAFRVHLNKAEMAGELFLCAHFMQSEVD
jgi:hypothetical protein